MRWFRFGCCLSFVDNGVDGGVDMLLLFVVVVVRVMYDMCVCVRLVCV